MLTLLFPYLKRNYRARFLGFFLIGLMIAGSACFWGGKSAAIETSFPADQFVNSIGMNVRMSYSDWPTATNWNNPDPEQNIRTLLANLGVRHLRDRIPHPDLQTAISYVNPRLATLYLEHGMKFTVGMDFRENGVLDESQIPPFTDWYANGEIVAESGTRVRVRDMLDAIEGPNEYDRHNTPDQREENWSSNLQSFQAAMYQSIKSTPQLASLPVLAPSLIYPAYCGSPVQSFEGSSNLGNLHPYPNYPYMRHPTATLNWYLQNNVACTGQLPNWVTETGYSTVKDDPTKISEVTAAKYTSRLLPEYALTGKIRRTFLHEIARGSVDGWGLIAAEPGKDTTGAAQFTLRPKPAYYAVQSLLQLLKEATWVPGERRWVAPPVNVKPVELSFASQLPTTHHLLLQKSTGRYFLLLWQEVESYNPTQGNFSVPPDEMTVVLPANTRAISLYQYDGSFKYTRRSLNNARGAVALSVPDSVMVLEFAT